MWDRVAEELPRFFTYYNMVFFLKAMFTTFLLSLIGCVLGSHASGPKALQRVNQPRNLRSTHLNTCSRFYRRYGCARLIAR